MTTFSLEKELKENSYPGRGIVIGRSADGKHAVTAYFIMGRSENSRNRIFVEDGEGIRTQAFDPSKLTDPSLIIYAPVRVLGNKTIVTNGDRQIRSMREWTDSSPLNSLFAAESLSRMRRTIHLVFRVFFMLKTVNSIMRCLF